MKFESGVCHPSAAGPNVHNKIKQHAIMKKVWHFTFLATFLLLLFLSFTIIMCQHSLGSKPTHAILLCPWERHFTAHSPAW